MIVSIISMCVFHDDLWLYFLCLSRQAHHFALFSVSLAFSPVTLLYNHVMIICEREQVLRPLCAQYQFMIITFPSFFLWHNGCDQTQTSLSLSVTIIMDILYVSNIFPLVGLVCHRHFCDCHSCIVLCYVLGIKSNRKESTSPRRLWRLLVEKPHNRNSSLWVHPVFVPFILMSTIRALMMMMQLWLLPPLLFGFICFCYLNMRLIIEIIKVEPWLLVSCRIVFKEKRKSFNVDLLPLLWFIHSFIHSLHWIAQS